MEIGGSLGRYKFNWLNKGANMETLETAETIKETSEHNDPFKSRAALVVSILAMFLAIASLGGSNAAKEATLHNILAANSYAFYQAKNIRQTSYKIAADELEISLTKKLDAETLRVTQKKLDDYKKNIARYESEPDTKEGKKELMVIAKGHEHERDVALRKDPWFDSAEALLQIGIVLASVAILTSMPALLIAAIVLGLGGIFSTFNGFLLFI